MKKSIHIGSDHAGFELKSEIIKFLETNNYQVTDHGANSNESVDYPDFGHAVAKAVLRNNDFGIIICGSGNGINMTANTHKGIRSALCWNTEIAGLARQHNNANILALPARFINATEAIAMAKVFLETEFEGGRHQKRADKINC
jgi:ribose 5-phosphate isomerase B